MSAVSGGGVGVFSGGGFRRATARPVLLVSVAALLVLVSVLPRVRTTHRAGVSHSASTGVRGVAALRRLESLPVDAQSTISSRLGEGARGFAAQRVASGYRLGVSRRGLRGAGLIFVGPGCRCRCRFWGLHVVGG